MRVKLYLDDELVQRLKHETGIQDEQVLVGYALRELKRMNAVRKVKDLQGIFKDGGWEDPYEEPQTAKA